MKHRHIPARPVGHAHLVFRSEEELDLVDDPLARDLSAAASIGRCIFVASDEGATIERLVTSDGRTYTEHTDTPIADFLDLPDGADGEMDVEGLAIDGGYLWIVGSHSLKRDQPDPAEDDLDSALSNLSDIDRDPNRWFLGCVPLADRGDGLFEMVKKVKSESGTRRARKLPMGSDGSNQLSDAAAKDPHFGPFLDVPSKENGFDIEGLAVAGDRVFVGLRGPVLRGWAIILELCVKAKKKRHLKLRKVDDGRYRKHFVDLEGLGIRDLLLHGEDLLILAGPTMDLDGPTRLYRWSRPLETKTTSVTARAVLDLVADLPFGHGHDHAEALSIVGEDGHLLVAYDSPAPARLSEDGTALTADLFDLGNMSTGSLDTRHAGGGWYDVHLWGLVVDRVKGAERARARAEEIESFQD